MGERPDDDARRLRVAFTLVTLAGTAYAFRSAPAAMLAALAGFIAGVTLWHRRLWSLRPEWRFVPLPLVFAVGCFGAVRLAQRVVESDAVTVYLSNIDDHEQVFVDGRRVGQADFLDTRTVPLGSLPNTARITIVAVNDGSGYTWGVRVTRHDRATYCEKAGHAGILGGGAFANDTTLGVVRRLVFDGTGRLLSASHAAVSGSFADRGIPRC